MPISSEMLYDHYKDSYQQVLLHLGKRDRYFILAVILLLGSMFVTFYPKYVEDIAKNVSATRLGFDVALAFHALNSIVVVLSLWHLVRYYQAVLTIENLYSYIHKIEDQLCKDSKDFIISREGKSYLSPYPMLKSCIHMFYVIIVPIAVVLAALIKIYWEWCRLPNLPLLSRILDILALLAIILLTLLYLSWIHFKDFKRR